MVQDPMGPAKDLGPRTDSSQPRAPNTCPQRPPAWLEHLGWRAGRKGAHPNKSRSTIAIRRGMALRRIPRGCLRRRKRSVLTDDVTPAPGRRIRSCMTLGTGYASETRMTDLAKLGEDAPAPGRGLRRVGRGAAFLGSAGLLLELAGFRSSADEFMRAGMVVGLLGAALALVTLAVAVAGSRRYPKETLESLTGPLILSFLLILPTGYFEALGSKRGDESSASRLFVPLFLAAFALAPITFFALLFAGFRSRDAK